uniref:Uncharacterized protein n=1 Tax=Sarcophilus harrisii TaxID=9305 RepID=A0A7N4NRH7_SARHA
MQRQQRGKNVVYQFLATLEDLCNGAIRKLALQKIVICDKYKGLNIKKGTKERNQYQLLIVITSHPGHILVTLLNIEITNVYMKIQM